MDCKNFVDDASSKAGFLLISGFLRSVDHYFPLFIISDIYHRIFFVFFCYESWDLRVETNFIRKAGLIG